MRRRRVPKDCPVSIVAAACLVPYLLFGVGCSDPPDPPTDGGVDVVGDSPDEVSDAPPDEDALDGTVESSPDVGPDGDWPDADDASIDADLDASEAGLDATTDQEADAPPDGPPDPNQCGDGWRDPAVEECDDGVDPASALDRACTSSCTVLDRLMGGDPGANERRLGAGRHPVAAGELGHAVAFMEMTNDDVRVVVSTYSPVGVRLSAVHQGAVPYDANPVVAALPNGDYAVAFSSFTVDGDGLGVELAIVSNDGVDWVTAGHANETTVYTQHNPDIVWTGSELVVGWEDDAPLVRRVCTRRFDQSLMPIGHEDCGGKVVQTSLVSLCGAAVAWRQDDSLGTRFTVRVPGGSWQSASFPLAGQSETLAMTEVEPGVFVFTFVDGEGVLRFGIVNDAGVELLPPTALNAPDEPRAAPAVVATLDGIYLAWQEPAWFDPQAGWDPVLEETWLQRLTWDGTTLDASAAPLVLPRTLAHQAGDQRGPALAAAPYWPTGAVFAAWDDLTADNYGGEAEHGDVAVQLIPTPVLRLPLAY